MAEAKLLQGDCLERMASLPDRSVDMVLCDPPYGTTEAYWDQVIPFNRLWAEYRRVVRRGGAIVLTAQQPFTTLLVYSNIKAFRYCWTWKKSRATGFANAKKRPLKVTEDVVVFCDQAPPYFPQGVRPLDRPRVRRKAASTETMKGQGFRDGYAQTMTGYPKNLIEFPCEQGLHPTQKPVALMAYLIRTYTQPGEVVLDNTMGSGTAGVAAMQCGRDFIGIERDAGYFEVARGRIAEAYNGLHLAEVA